MECSITFSVALIEWLFCLFISFKLSQLTFAYIIPFFVCVCVCDDTAVLHSFVALQQYDCMVQCKMAV